ncbi:hypothetical protein GBAR_LOCUS14724 [Geodia barretti]|uniref:Uncharacterized protein n=1 Tax=Geodia barretti TaxID=519541 RepID=A0AA35WQJ2_GEOBA|nr:hypothetical protein GBAR_LOCUS14724 [Geodia barretti]
MVSDPSQLLQAWTQHFQSLTKSQEENNPSLKESIKQSSTLLSATFQNGEVFLDVPFNTEEVEHTVNKMKLKKSSGPDNLTAEHLKFGGQTIITWPTEILNSIDVERIPSCLKLGITIPVYKGGGKDPSMQTGITLNSVISKVFRNPDPQQIGASLHGGWLATWKKLSSSPSF